MHPGFLRAKRQNQIDPNNFDLKDSRHSKIAIFESIGFDFFYQRLHISSCKCSQGDVGDKFFIIKGTFVHPTFQTIDDCLVDFLEISSVFYASVDCGREGAKAERFLFRKDR